MAPQPSVHLIRAKARRVPELPEVETTMRLIAPQIEGKSIRGVTAGWERSLGGRSLASFRKRVVGRRVGTLRRRGKYIVLPLHKGRGPAGDLVGHLRMSGRLVVLPPRERPAYARVSLALSGGKVFHFLDVRKFGRLEFCANADERLKDLGLEPLGPDFTAAWLRGALAKRKRRIKPLLLDQSLIAGLGNIYVDESLHASRIHPERPACRISRAAVSRLHANIRAILRRAIEREGSSFDSFYRTPEGSPGSYQHLFAVYGRAGKACGTCGSVIRRIVVAQRGTHICSRCQRAPRL